MGGGRGALLEPRLVDSSLKEVWSRRSHFRHDDLFQNLSHVGPHHDGPDVLQLRLVKSFIFGEWHKSPVIEVLWD